MTPSTVMSIDVIGKSNTWKRFFLFCFLKIKTGKRKSGGGKRNEVSKKREPDLMLKGNLSILN